LQPVGFAPTGVLGSRNLIKCKSCIEFSGKTTTVENIIVTCLLQFGNFHMKTNKYFSSNGKDGTLVHIMDVMERAVSSWQ
jgi:hypothetical protein